MNQMEKAKENNCKVIPFQSTGNEDLRHRNQLRLSSTALVVYLFFRARNINVSFEVAEELAFSLLKKGRA